MDKAERCLAVEAGYVKLRSVLLVDQATERRRHFQAAFLINTCRVIAPQHKHLRRKEWLGGQIRKSVLSDRFATRLDHSRPLLTTRIG